MKKGRESKESLAKSVRQCLDEYATLYVFSFENMRNTKFKEFRDNVKESSRFASLYPSHLSLFSFYGSFLSSNQSTSKFGGKRILNYSVIFSFNIPNLQNKSSNVSKSHLNLGKLFNLVFFMLAMFGKSPFNLKYS